MRTKEITKSTRDTEIIIAGAIIANKYIFRLKIKGLSMMINCNN